MLKLTLSVINALHLFLVTLYFMMSLLQSKYWVILNNYMYLLYG